MQHKLLLLLVLGFLFMWNDSHAQVNADFTYSTASGCGSLQVSFCDNSTSVSGSITSWNWDLGGAPSNLECPGRIFVPGTYTICLTVTDAGGFTDTECKTDLIRVFNLPEPDFMADSEENCAPATVSFTDMSGSADGNITEWLWGLGGSCGTIVSNTANTPAAVCTYSIPDEYSVSLTVTDDNGCVNSITKSNYIKVADNPSVSVAVSSNFGCSAPFTVSFLNTTIQSTDMDFVWDFGNMETFTGDTPPPVTYTSDGVYSITVIGTNTVTHCSDTLLLEDYITVGYPIDFSYTPDVGCPGMSVTFTDLSPNVASDITWDFGDGNTSSEANPTYVYTTPGCYFPKLTRTVSGCVTERFGGQCIQVQAPANVNVSNDNNIGCSLPHVVNFTGIASGVTSWLWDFGDGTLNSTLQNPTHVYNQFGDFEVTLITTNSTGCSDTTLVNTIEVQEVEAILVDDQITGCAPLEIILGEASQSVTNIVSWSWQVPTNTSTFISNSDNPIFTITDIGVFDVHLTVTNTLGCSDTRIFPGAIAIGDNPSLSFEATPVESCIEQAITFTDMSDPTVDYWFWDFGDGNDTEEQHPVHFYLDTGYFDVNLIASHNGCVSSITYADFIHITAPVAKFDVLEFCDNTFQRKFKNNAVGADSVFWDFGVLGTDLDTSMSVSPTFIYPDTGYYDVSMTVFNYNTGCQHTRVEQIHITHPVARFFPADLTGCAPMAVDLIDQSEFGMTYTWSTPNGELSETDVAEPSIFFEDPGAYTDIQLIIRDENNCRDTMVFTDTIFVNNIVVDITADVSGGCAPLAITFADNSNNLFNTNSTWEWDFGTGLGTSNLETPTFSFDDVGDYGVSLTVTDSWGCSATETFDNFVSATFPTAFFETEDFGCTGSAITFSNFSDGEDLTYLWDFGDGTSSEESPEHAYSLEGVFTVCLTITDVNGCDDTFCLDDFITITDPKADFTVDNNFASCPPLTVNYENLSLDATEYLWDFGDGSGLSTETNPTHVYTIPGSYEVMLIASSTPYCHDTLIFDDLIILDGPVGDYSFAIDSSCAPMEVTFMGSSVADYEYTWDLGNGVVINSNDYIDNDTFTYVYTVPGTYTPTLSLENISGCFRTLPNIGDIHVASLKADFVASDTLLCDDNVPITFYNFSNSTDPLTYVEWSFEGGNPLTSTEIEETVTFDNVGSYDVTMIVSNGFCEDTLTRTDYISIGPKPVADFAMDSNAGCEPLTVNFTDNSSISTGTIDDWQWDFGDNNTASIPNPTHDFNAGVDIPVTLVVTSEEGCMDTLVQTLTVFEATSVDLGDDVEICLNETVQLVATVNGNLTGATYNWSPSTGLSCTDCLMPEASPSDTTIYSFTLTNAEGCVTTEEVVVRVKPFAAPTINMSPDITICLGTNTQLLADVGPGNFTYEWDLSRPGLDCYLNCADPVATPTITTTYAVTVTNEFGCSSQDSVTVSVLNESQSFAGEDKIICEGGNTQLSVSMGNNPTWLVGAGLSCTSCPNPTATPSVPTEYIVEVTTDFGCLIRDTVFVDLVAPDAIEAGTNQSICAGESLMLVGIGTGTVSWSPAASLDNPNVFNPEAIPTTTTTYLMTVTIGECTLTDEVTIEVTEYTNVELEDVTICEGEEIALEVDGQADYFEWLPGNGLTDLTVASPVVNPTDTTQYTLIATLGSCLPDTATMTVNVIPGPITAMEPVRNFFPSQPFQMELEAESNGFYAYLWSPEAGLSCVTCLDPVVTLDSAKTYYVTTTDFESGCSTVDSVFVAPLSECPEELIAVPNIFSPNDDGFNDKLEVFLSATIQGMDIGAFRVYDRWGALVYESNDISQGWDGTHLGKPLPQGVYLYYVEAPCPATGGVFIAKGDVTLLR